MANQEKVKTMIQIAQPFLGEEEWAAARVPILSGWLTQGPQVVEFEKEFAAYLGVKHAIATTSCTTALHLILAGMGIGPGDEVIVPSFTWVATANAVLYCGAHPVIVDVDPLTYNIDPKDVRAKLTPKTKAILAVHLFGVCADMEGLKKAAPGIPIIEDAACASGSALDQKSAGNLGLAAAFSFHPRKVITTGEGGMVTTNDDQLAEKMRILRNHGASISEEERHSGPQPYLLPDFSVMGFNYRMTDIQAAVGLVQLKRLEGLIQERQEWATYYYNRLEHIPWLQLPTLPSNCKTNWQSFVCKVRGEAAQVSTRNRLMKRLYDRGISTRPGTHAIHMLSYYKERYGFKPGDLPNSKGCAELTIALPLHNKMKPEDYDYVVKTLSEETLES